MPAGCNCGPNSPLARALGCHCVRRGTTVNASQLPLLRLYSAAVQDCKWRYIKWASYLYLSMLAVWQKYMLKQRSGCYDLLHKITVFWDAGFIVIVRLILRQWPSCLDVSDNTVSWKEEHSTMAFSKFLNTTHEAAGVGWWGQTGGLENRFPVEIYTDGSPLCFLEFLSSSLSSHYCYYYYCIFYLTLLNYFYFILLSFSGMAISMLINNNKNRKNRTHLLGRQA